MVLFWPNNPLALTMPLYVVLATQNHQRIESDDDDDFDNQHDTRRDNHRDDRHHGSDKREAIQGVIPQFSRDWLGKPSRFGPNIYMPNG